jgi:2,4-dienoyl-CoA reductase-like NADH-dependent reductase (Old Yellow Enzyme family)
MWRPPERIRYEATFGRVPSREEAEKSRLFSPVRVGPVTLAQRTWVPAMVPWRATEDGFVTDEVIAWYTRFARGRYLAGLRKLVDAVREASAGETRLLIQIIDFLAIRRRPDPQKFLQRFLAVTDAHRRALGDMTLSDDAVRARLVAMEHFELTQILSAAEMEALDYGTRERVTDTHLDHIRTLPQTLPPLFADAAARARTAGFDGVELHYAHAYTMASFLSRTNSRDDGYGGSPENRMRLPLKVYAAVRERVGQDFAVGCRFLADECIAGGSEVDDTRTFGVAFAKAGMDFLSTSRGGKFDDAKQPSVGWAAYPYTGPSGYECMPQYISDARGPFGRNAAATAAIRADIRAAGLETPIVCAGGVHNFEMAETMLADGVCDIVGAARQSLADPDWFRKIALGRGSDVRVCEFTNYCEGLDQKHKAVTCQLWDKLDLDAPGVRLSADGKRRMVAPDWDHATDVNG